MSFEVSVFVNIIIIAVTSFFSTEKSHFKTTKPVVYILTGVYIVWFMFFHMLSSG